MGVLSNIFFPYNGWRVIPNATSVIYQSGPLDQSTYFRRALNYTENGIQKKLYSNNVLITALTPSVTPGSISANQTVHTSVKPMMLQSVMPPTNSGGYTLFWMSASSSSGPWTRIPNELQLTYQPDYLTQTTYFKRGVSSNMGTIVYSNVICITVAQPFANQNYVVEYTPQIETAVPLEVSTNQCVQAIQYFDGLGRPSQSVQVGGTPTQKDLVSQQKYDACGRETQTWLPAVVSANNGAYVKPELLETMAKISNINDAAPYTTSVYETSPLKRVIEQYDPGSTSYTQGKSIRTEYMTNSESGDLICAEFVSSDNRGSVEISILGNYPTGRLSVTKISDEDGRNSYEFKNNQDQLVLSRQVYNSIHYDTYYVYDSYGNLKSVFPPKATELILDNADELNEGSVVRNELSYAYMYDSRNRCIQKKIPGVADMYIVYDDVDYPVFTQTGTQRTREEWLFSIPDRFGRTVLTGICKLMNGRVITVGCLINKEVKANYVGMSGYLHGYTLIVNEEEPMTLDNCSVLTVDYYDNYLFMDFAEFDGLGYNLIRENEGYGKRYVESSKTLRTGSLIAILENGITQAQTYYYDSRKRLIQSNATNYLGGVSSYAHGYDFTGNTIKTRESHQKSATSAEDILLSNFSYDHVGRLLVETTSLNGGAATRTSCIYNELGQLSNKKFGVDGDINQAYVYNVRGWLTEQTNSKFGMKLRYHDPVQPSTIPSYTGNITEWEWQHKDSPTSPVNTYAFSYDGLSRLNNTDQYIGNTLNNQFVEQGINYDRNGNILTLKRYESGTLSDDYNYSYTGNQLATLNGTINYTYDADGNMTYDGRQNLDLEYNHLNLLSKVRSSGTTKANYSYLADGTKVGVVGADGKGFDYMGSLVYSRDGENLTLESAEFSGGRIIISESASGKVYEPNYFLTDHLGSVRVVVGADGRVRERNNYHAYGERWQDSGSLITDNRYGFSGKERQTVGDLELWDFGARMYDGIAWATPDPLTEEYFSISPYAYCSGNPVNRVDPDGKDWYFNIGGKLLGKDELKTDLIRVIDQSVWGVNQNALGMISGEVGAASSVLFSQAGLSDQASLNVYQHFNMTGEKLNAVNDLSEGAGNMSTNISFSSEWGVGKTIYNRQNEKYSDLKRKVKNCYSNRQILKSV